MTGTQFGPKDIIGNRETDPSFDPTAPWGGDFRIDGVTRSMLAAAIAIIDAFDPDSLREWTLLHCRDGHCGPGVYLCFEDQNGSYFVGRSECERDDWRKAKAKALRLRRASQ